MIPAKPKAPVSLTSPERIKLTLQAQRLQCKQQQILIEQMKHATDFAVMKVTVTKQAPIHIKYRNMKTRLRNKFLKNPNAANKENYTKYRNY